MSWAIASEIGRIVAVSHLLLVTMLFTLRMRGWERISVLFMGLGGAAFVLFPLLSDLPDLAGESAPPYILLPVAVLQIGLTYWLWFFALIQGDPDFRPNWRHWLLLAGKIAITLAWAAPRRPIYLPISPEEEFIWRALIPALISLGFTIAAVVVSGHRLADELAEERRALRRLVIIWGAGAIGVGAASILLLRGPVLAQLGSWLTVALALSAAISLHVWMARNGAPSPIQAASAGDSPERAELAAPGLQRLAGRIEELFQNEDYYATEGLTVTQLASRLEERDYKVRRAINGVLGYRNFNAFLNQYRVAEAQRRLLAEPELPVLRLAMDLGYRSLAGFNKAFKDETRRTPTEFRRQAADLSHPLHPLHPLHPARSPGAQNPD
ncbi:MAG: AraC family transcriptional regulator [bacterium]|nr:AraC family transcriptional regulator [bacterium]